MVKLSANYSNGALVIQPHDYVEDGWVIEYTAEHGWRVFEIPQYGGNEVFIEKFDSFDLAYIKAKSLT